MTPVPAAAVRNTNSVAADKYNLADFNKDRLTAFRRSFYYLKIYSKGDLRLGLINY